MTTILRSYTNLRRPDSSFGNIKIWEAVRATSAASTFFDPIALGPFWEYFVDGATGANNPVRELWTEASDVWRWLGPLEATVGCIVSIGTGAHGVSGFGDSLIQVAKTLKRLAVETEKTAETFEREHYALAEGGQYFRFNVTRGLENVGLEDSQMAPQISAATTDYLSSDLVSNSIRKCAHHLRQISCEYNVELQTLATTLTAPWKTGSDGSQVPLSSREILPAKDLMCSIDRNLESYWGVLRQVFDDFPGQYRKTFASANTHQVFEGPRAGSSLSFSYQVIPVNLIESAEALAAQVGLVVEAVRPTLDPDALQNSQSALALIRGAFLAIIGFGLKNEAYYQPIASAVSLILDYLHFLSRHTLGLFSDSLPIRATFFNAYRHILRICRNICIVFLGELGGGVALARYLRQDGPWQRVEDSLSNFKKVISEDSDFATVTVLATIAPENVTARYELDRDRIQILETLSRMDRNAEHERLQLREKVILWVSDLEYYHTQDEFSRIRHKGSGSWLLERPEFQGWFDSPESSILWCWGAPGIGKTILCSAVQSYISRVLSGTPRAGFAFAYCTFRETKHPTAYLLSYLRQLLSQLPYLPPGVHVSLYTSIHPSLFPACG